MNSKERMVQIRTGNIVDRFPPIRLSFGTEYICKISGVPDYEFLYGDSINRAKAHIACFERHSELDSIVIWGSGRTKDWIKNHEIEIGKNQAWLINRKTSQKWPLSKDYYAVYMDSLPSWEYPFVGDYEMIIEGQQYHTMDKFEIGSEKDVDELLPLEEAVSVKERGMFDTVKIVAHEVGDKFYIESGAGSIFRYAIGYLGFQRGFICMHERPELLKYLLERVLAQQIEHAKVLKENGADGIHVGELWAGADLISEKDYEQFAFPYTKEYIQEVHRLGLKAILYFCGDVLPRLSRLREMSFDALAVEESFDIDIEKVRRIIGNDVCLVGNVDPVLIERGSKEEIKREVMRQISAAGIKNRLIVGSGSTVTLNTDPQNVDTFVNAALEFQR